MGNTGQGDNVHGKTRDGQDKVVPVNQNATSFTGYPGGISKEEWEKLTPETQQYMLGLQRQGILW